VQTLLHPNIQKKLQQPCVSRVRAAAACRRAARSNELYRLEADPLILRTGPYCALLCCCGNYLENTMEAIRELLGECKLEAVAHRREDMLRKVSDSTSVRDAVAVCLLDSH
jgi:hypothetical protein